MQTKIKQFGFTLIEVIVVIGITGFLLALAIPAENTYRRRAEIKTSVKDLRSLLWEAQSRSLAPRSKDVTAYRVTLMNGQSGPTSPIHIQECTTVNLIETCNAIIGSQEPQVLLGANVYIKDIVTRDLGGSVTSVGSSTVARTSFAVGNNKDSGVISFSVGGVPQPSKSSMVITVASVAFPSSVYDIVIDRQTNNISFTAE